MGTASDKSAPVNLVTGALNECVKNGSTKENVLHQSRGTSNPNVPLTKEETIRLRKAYISDACTLFFHEDPLKIVRARGQYMYDDKGTQYLDCINNVAHVGHCHPKVVAATSAQLAQQCTNSRFLHDSMVLCAQRIASTMPKELSSVFFVNSGSEANDLAIRLSRHFTGNKDCVILDHAYHGHTSIVTDISPHKFHKIKNYKMKRWVHMAPQPDAYRGIHRNPEHSEEELGAMYAQEVSDVVQQTANEGRGICLFLAESLQSCAGQVFLPKGYLKPVYESIRAAGGLCLADEVQTGFGRIGTHYWAFEEQGVVPDFVTIGKSMGNGFPVAALVTRPDIANVFLQCGVEYFNTYGGNAAACVTALAVMDVIEEERLMQHAKEVGAYLLEKLLVLQNKHVLIGDVRGKGLFLGIEFVADRTSRSPDPKTAYAVILQLREHNIILSVEGPDNNVVKIKPPMCFTLENADMLVHHLDQCLTSFRG